MRTPSPRLVLAALAALVLVPGSVASAADPTRLPFDVEDVPAERNRWYGIYAGGGKSGWYRETLRKTADALVYETEMSFEAKAMGQAMKIHMTDTHEFDPAPPFALRTARMKIVQPMGNQSVEVRGGPMGYVATHDGGGTKRELPLAGLDYSFADVLTLERWFASTTRKTGDAVSFRMLDLQEVRPDVQTALVRDVKTGMVQGVETTWYEATLAQASKGEIGVARYDRKGLLLSAQLGGLMEFRVEPEDQAKKLEAGADLFLDTVVRVEGMIAKGADVPKVRELVLEVTGPGTKTLKSSPRQGVEPRPDGSALVRLGAGHGTPDAADEDEVREALEETMAYPTRLPKVVALAAEAVGTAKTPLEKTERIVHFVSDFLKDELCPQFVPAERLLDTRGGDCSEHALLFVTLARAAGLPARQVAGVMYMGDEQPEVVRGFGAHAWSEVAIDGHWVPVDATHGQVNLDATHVAFARKGYENDFAAASGPARLKFRVQSVVPDPATTTAPARSNPVVPDAPAGGAGGGR